VGSGLLNIKGNLGVKKGGNCSMATADPPGDPLGDEPDGRPTLTEHHSPRGDRLASDDPSTPGTRGRLPVQHPEGYSEQNKSGARRRIHIILILDYFGVFFDTVAR